MPFVSWKGERFRELARSARRSAIVAAAVTAGAAALGARDAMPLLLIALSAFAADMNLRAVIRKTRNAKLGGAGGYLAHVGVGIMMAGIVVSGVYAQTRRVKLPIGQPTKVDDTLLTFLRVVPGSADRKQAMEIRVEGPGKKPFFAYPKMYVNTKTNQLMVNPSIRKTAVRDFYVAPQEYDPGQPERRGRDVRLTKGTTQNVEGVGLTFRDFNADRAAMLRGEKTVLVLADVTITPPDGSKHDATLRYVFHMDGREAEAEEVPIPGAPGATMRVLAVSPNDGAVALRLRGISRNPADEYEAATTESLSVEVTRKPLISLVWGGFYVMMGGALLAFVKRAREARKVVLADGPEPSREPSTEGLHVPASPVTVHTSST